MTGSLGLFQTFVDPDIIERVNPKTGKLEKLSRSTEEAKVGDELKKCAAALNRNPQMWGIRMSGLPEDVKNQIRKAVQDAGDAGRVRRGNL